jgi:sugar phosphate isomerase/epimerase
MKTNRRDFFKVSGFGIVSATIPTFPSVSIINNPGNTGKCDFQLGIASYSLRKFLLEDTLVICNRLGINKIALKSFHLPMDASDEEIKLTIEKCNNAGVEVYGGGAIPMKNKEDIDIAFEYARKAGMKVVIGVPEHELIPYVESKVKEYDIKMAIHNHGPHDNKYPTVKSAYERIKSLDLRMGLCIDIGHIVRGGNDPSDDAQKFFDRIHDIHVKDIDQINENGKDCEIGRGVIDFPKFLKTLADLDYKGVLSLEYEKDEDDPLPGMAESFGYIRGILVTMKNNNK